MARQICAECPVKQPCLDFANENGIRWGVWGGESERSRAKMRARARQNPPKYV